MMRVSNLVVVAAVAALPSLCISSRVFCGQDEKSVVEISDTLALAVCGEKIFRVVKTPKESVQPAAKALASKKSLMMRSDWPQTAASFKVNKTVPGVVRVTTEQGISVLIDLSTEKISFTDPERGGLRETGHAFTPTEDPSNPPGAPQPFVVEQSWAESGDEWGLYGGGQYQSGFTNFRNSPLNMIQFNTEAIVPFFASSNGQGLLWDNNARSILNPPNSQPIAVSPAPGASARSEEKAGAALPLLDGMPIGVAPCDPPHSIAVQAWVFNASSGRLTAQGQYNPGQDKMVLDCDGCAVGHPVHVWQSEPSLDDNQRFSFDASTGLIANQNFKTCLAGSALHGGGAGALRGVTAAMKQCDASDKSQVWEMDASTQAVRLKEAQEQQQCLQVAFDGQVLPFIPTASGPHSFFASMCDDYGCGMNQVLYIKLTAPQLSRDGSAGMVVQDWNGLANLPDAVAGAALNLTKGTNYTLFFKASIPGTKLYAQGPAAGGSSVVLRSELGQVIDYYYVAGKSLDEAVQGYRNMTGEAYLYPKWAYGFWQCKEHYHNQSEILRAVQGFRERRIPVDAFVQDWHYWGDLGWGPQWDPKIYPEPRAMMDNFTANDIHFMVSVWSKFDTSTYFYNTMMENGQILQNSQYYDPWNEAAREQFYQFSKAVHFDIGVDSLWLDATEPENFAQENRSTAQGSGNALFNSYSLMTTQAIADGLRRDFAQAQGRRVFSLSRSSFAGQQRTGATLWSGDITSAWDTLRRQVAASLNFQLSGMPYWSEDIGGFFRPSDQYTDPEYLRLLTRWFQFGVFTPIFRVHGGGSNTELWNYGPSVQHNIVSSAIRLRYRLLPYVYSGFHRVASQGYTMQRHMAFDFANTGHAATDAAAKGLSDQYMFGPALLVAPIVSDGLSRPVFLPFLSSGAGWTNFYTGETVTGVGNLDVETNLTTIPLFASAGSILLLGPDLQYTGEKAADPIEVRVYGGSDGKFDLFEDDGLSSDASASTLISFQWRDSKRQLFIGQRTGKGFAGQLNSRTFKVVLVRPGVGVGIDPTPDARCKAVTYTGQSLTVEL